MSLLIKGSNFADVYEQLLWNLHHEPEFDDISPRGMKIKEIRDVLLEIKHSDINMFTNDVRDIDHRYLAGELLWYFSGRNDLEFIKEYSSFWENIVNDNGTLNSAYGMQIFKLSNQYGFTEWEWARYSLLKDYDTRQAIIRFNKPYVSFMGNKDFVCTLTGTFSIRDGKLDLSIVMRSSDAILGLTYDVPFFSLLIQAMRVELLSAYPDLQIGKLTLLLHSSHIYERHFNLVEDMLDNPFHSYSLPEYKANLICKPIDFLKEHKSLDGDGLVEWIRRESK